MSGTDIQELRRLAEAARDAVPTKQGGIAVNTFAAACDANTILALIEVCEAANTYYTRYAQDEAADDGGEMTGCGQQQHEDAKRLRTALEGVKK